MKTDRFNEDIRRKLEGIEPPFDEKDWSKFQAFSKQQMPPSWWAKTGAKWMGYGASGLVATVLIITNIIQYQENKELKQTVAQLQQQIQQPPLTQKTDSESYTLQTPSNESTLPDSSVEKTDQPQALTNRSDEPYSTGNERDKAEAITRAENRRAIEAERQYPTSPVRENESVAAGKERAAAVQKSNSLKIKENIQSDKEESAELTQDRNTQFVLKAEKGNPIRNSFSNERYSEVKRGTSEKTAKRAVGETSSEELNKSLVEAQNRSAVEVLSKIDSKTISPRLSFEAFPGGVPQFTKIPVKRKFYHWAGGASSPEVTSEQVARTPKIRLPKENNINIRAGLGLDLEKNYVGKSLVAGVNVGKHWGLSLGLSKGVIQGQQYKDERVFMERNRFDFKKRYVPHIPPTPLFAVKNITTEAEVVRMPVAVNYRFPLAKAWTLYASAGTTFDLKVDEKFQFDLEKWNNKPIRDQVMAKPRQASVFNNVNAGFGVEKQWNHFVVQAETYIAPGLKDCSFRQEKAPAGLRIRALYQF